MKYLSLVLFLLLIFGLSQNACAMPVIIDTVYADSIYNGVDNGAYNVMNPGLALMKSDNRTAKLAEGSLLDLGFRNSHHNALIPIKHQTTLLVWGKKDKSVDSSAGQVVFYQADQDGALIYKSKPFILEDGLNIINVPDSDFTYIELSIFVDPGPTQHAKSYLVDAVAVLEDTVKSSVISPIAYSNKFIAYPNPFLEKTTIRFTTEGDGEAELSIVDALGRETGRIPAGYLETGTHEIPLAIKTPGLYFVRLFVNGQPVGMPLKINSQ